MSNHYSFKILFILKGKKSNTNIVKYKNSQDIHLNNDKYKVTLTSDVTPGFVFAKSFIDR